MDCPRCAVEMVQLEGEGSSMARCPECTGLWLDIAEVNRLLLRHNLPGLESIGGHPNPDEVTGTCPECQIDLVAVEGGEKRSMVYETCEICGGIFIDDIETEESIETAIEAIVDFYRRFAHSKGSSKGL